MSAHFRDTDSTREPAENVSAFRSDGERFRLLVENSRDIIVEISGEHEILYVSPNVAAVLGYAPAELIGANLFERVHPEDVVEVWTQFEQRAGCATCRYRHKDGSWRWLESTGREFATLGGAMHRVLVARDITAQKHIAAERDRLEAELVRAEKLSVLGTLAGGMAHDFNNLLTAILAYADLARSQSPGADLNMALDQITRAGERAKSIARHVLEFSRHQRRERVPVMLPAVAREVISLLRVMIPPQIEIAADLAEEDCTILGNAAQLHQVLLNLCQNAIHAMHHQRGRLVVRVTRTVVDESFPRKPATLRSGLYVCLAVIDNGHGMEKATLRRIFEPFFTTKALGDGTGLGLAVVKNIVRDHRGVIDVSSQPEKGTEFRIFFPARDERSKH